MAGTHGCVGRQRSLLFTLVRAAGDPHGTARTPLLPQRVTRCDRVGGNCQVVLDVAGHVHAARRRSDGAKAVGVSWRLRTDQDAVRQRVAEQRGHAPVAIDRPRRDARAAEQQRNPPPSELGVQGRPDLGLEDDRHLR